MSSAADLLDLEAAGEDELFARLEEIRAQQARALLKDPATLARGLDPTYTVRPHTRVIADAMTGLVTGDYDRLLVICPPQTGKSTLVAEWGAFWWLAQFPTDRVGIASYGDDLALRHGQAIQDMVTEYGADYELTIRRGSASKQDWDLTTGGGVRSVGIGSGLTGFSINLLIVDDPHKDRADAESARSRKRVHDWYSSTALKRLQPDRNAVLGVQTRWHEEDWAGRRLKEEGRLEEGGRWKVVHLPAIADPKYGPDPLGRKPGEPLTHPKIPTRDKKALKAWWDDMKSTSIVRDWYALGQGDPRPAEGALVTAELMRGLRADDSGVTPQKIAVAVDPNGGGRDTAGIIGGYLGDDSRLWITHDRSGVMSSAEWAMAACRLAVEIHATRIIGETNYGGDMVELALKGAWKQLQEDDEIPAGMLMPKIEAVRAKQGKLLRAEPVAQQMMLGRVRLRGMLPDLEHEWATWMPTDPESPGRIDASVYLAYGLLQGIAGQSQVMSVAGQSRSVQEVGATSGLAATRIRR
ncbi:hypothetical protein ACFFR3_45985 [Nonomuraea salmonea]|uniref:Terminase n=1 Tax=Nonomuraea salmonea TaxID=46181 RepID=A0ABV5P300_9ACTN